MFEFKVLQELKPNVELLELLKDYTYKTKKGKVKHLLHTNLQFIEPTIYKITYPITLTILEYKVNEISNNQLEWVKLMNNYKNMAEEIILKELIYI
ncbi:MAG: TnpV protein [bacterium]|nr:TnpV protein [bacterium]